MDEISMSKKKSDQRGNGLNGLDDVVTGHEILSRINNIVLVARKGAEIIYASPSVERILGYKPEEMLGNGYWVKSFRDLKHRDRSRKRVAELVAGKISEAGILYENYLFTKSGTKEWILWQDAKGPGETLIGVGQVITKQKQITEQIKQTKSHLNGIIDNTSDLIWAVDTQFRLTLFNKTFIRFLHFRSGKKPYIGMPIYERLHSGKIEMWKNYYYRALAGNHFTVEDFILYPKDPRTYELSFNPVKKGNRITGISVFARDITQRKKSELSLARSREQYRTLINTMGEGLGYLDNTGKIIFANKRLCTMFGYSEKEFVGRNVFSLMDTTKDRKSIKEKLKNRKEGISEDYDISIRTKQGKSLWIHINASPVRDINGKVAGSVGTISDITEKRNMVERLTSVNKNLQTFLYRASHDLRAPLASMLGLINAGTMYLKEKSSGEYLEKMKITALKMDNLLKELTDITRLEGTESKYEKIKFGSLVSDIIGRLCNNEDFKFVKISVKSKTNKEFYSDPFMLDSILQNLICNAVKYRKRGILDPKVYIRLKKINRQYIISVSDNGIGIRADIQPKVFEMFFKGHEEISGTGLGLYMVKIAVEKLHGRVKLTSRQGQGTTVKVFLPVEKR